MKIIIKNKHPEVISDYQLQKALRNMEINCFIEFEESELSELSDDFLLAFKGSSEILKKETQFKEDIFLVSFYKTIKNINPTLGKKLFNKIMAFGIANYLEQVVDYRKKNEKDD